MSSQNCQQHTYHYADHLKALSQQGKATLWEQCVDYDTQSVRANFFFYLPNFDLNFVDNLKKRVKQQKGGILEEAPWVQKSLYFKPQKQPTFVLVSDNIFDCNDMDILKYDSSQIAAEPATKQLVERQLEKAEPGVNSLQAMQSIASTSKRRGNLLRQAIHQQANVALQAQTPEEFSEEQQELSTQTQGLKLEQCNRALFQLLEKAASGAFFVLPVSFLSRILQKLEVQTTKWHIDRNHKLLQVCKQLNSNAIFGFHQIKRTSQSSLHSQKRLHIDDLQTYHIYERISMPREEEKQYIHEQLANFNCFRIANFHQLSLDMPFGVSIFPSQSEKQRILAEREKYEQRGLEQIQKIVDESSDSKSPCSPIEENHYPAKEHNYCFVCQREFQDYNHHISSDKHKCFFEHQQSFLDQIDAFKDELQLNCMQKQMPQAKQPSPISQQEKKHKTHKPIPQKKIFTPMILSQPSQAERPVQGLDPKEEEKVLFGEENIPDEEILFEREPSQQTRQQLSQSKIEPYSQPKVEVLSDEQLESIEEEKIEVQKIQKPRQQSGTKANKKVAPRETKRRVKNRTPSKSPGKKAASKRYNLRSKPKSKSPSVPKTVKKREEKQKSKQTKIEYFYETRSRAKNNSGVNSINFEVESPAQPKVRDSKRQAKPEVARAYNLRNRTSTSSGYQSPPSSKRQRRS